MISIQSPIRIQARILATACLLLLASSSPPPASAQADVPCSAEFRAVPPELLNPVFSGIFDISIDWDLAEEGHAWNLDSLQAFADVIIDANENNGEELLGRLVEYFSVDLDESYDGVTIPQENGGSYSHFHICLREAAGEITSVGNQVLLASMVQVEPGVIQAVSAEQLARESFAHEWQHVTFDRIAPGPKFNAETGTNEYLSKCAEFYAGMDRMWPVHDHPYERCFLGGQDWFGDCIDTDHADHKYSSFGLFGAYLLEHFAGDPGDVTDDLLYRWLNYSYEDLFGHILYQIAPESLADILAGPAYQGYFSALSGAGRVAELFHEFALSLWVNSTSVEGEATVWAGGRRPQLAYQLFRNVNGLDCADDANTLPLVVTAGEQAVTVSGPIYPSDIYHGDDSACGSGYDSQDYPRYPQVATYGSSYLPFVADASLPADQCFELLVNLELEDEVYCPRAGQSIPAEPASNLELNVSVLAYSEARDSLDWRGDEAVELSRESYGLDELPQTLSFRVPCFASAWQSVVLALSVTEKTPSHGFVYNRIFPFRYTARALPSPSPPVISGEESWGGPGQTICLDRDLVVAPDGKLSILPGTKLLVAAGELSLRVRGELEVEGTVTDLVRFASALGPGKSWGSLEVYGGGEAKIHYAFVDGLSELTTLPGSELEIESVAWSAGDEPAEFLIQGEESELSGLGLIGAGRVTLDTGRIERSTICAAADQEGPLLVFGEDAEGCSDLVLVGGQEGILVDSGHPELGPRLKIIAAGAQEDRPRGLKVTGGALCYAHGIRIHGYDTGIELRGGASLVLRSSTLDLCRRGVLLSGGAGVADLGTRSIGEVGWGRNNFRSAPGVPMDLAIENRSAHTCLAQWNYWGTATPGDELFFGSVAWVPFSMEENIGGGIDDRGGEILELPEARVRLLGAWPNPFNPRVSLAFEVEGRAREIGLSIYDVGGRLVAQPLRGVFPPGRHEFTWEARDPAGRPFSSGVYFARLEGQPRSIKLLLLR